MICYVLPQFGSIAFELIRLNRNRDLNHFKTHIIEEAIAELALSFDPLIEDPRVCVLLVNNTKRRPPGSWCVAGVVGVRVSFPQLLPKI